MDSLPLTDRPPIDRRAALRRAGIAGVLATGMAPAAHARAAVRWRLASSFPKSLNTIYGAAEYFAQQVALLSAGRFEISVHAGGELMPAFGVVDGVQRGQVEACHTAPYYFFDKDETFALGCAIPFGLNSRQMTAWIYHGGGLQLMREFYANYDIVDFPAGNTGAQMGGWFRRELKSAADMQGLRFRVAGFAGRVIERLGGVPSNLPGTEVYPALASGRLDAAEWVGPYDDLKLGFHRVAPYYYYPGWWEGCAHIELFVNRKAWAALPRELQAVVEAASAMTHVDMQAKYDARNPVALKELVSQGAKLRPFPSDLMTEAFKTSMRLNEEIAAKNPHWRRVYAEYTKFRADQNLWFRFTEAGFDRFMQSQRL